MLFELLLLLLLLFFFFFFLLLLSSPSHCICLCVCATMEEYGPMIECVYDSDDTEDLEEKEEVSLSVWQNHESKQANH